MNIALVKIDCVTFTTVEFTGLNILGVDLIFWDKTDFFFSESQNNFSEGLYFRHHSNWYIFRDSHLRVCFKVSVRPSVDLDLPVSLACKRKGRKSVIYALQNFWLYLTEKPVKVITDHSTLIHFIIGKSVLRRRIRQALKIKEYNVIIENRAGATNVVQYFYFSLTRPDKWKKLYNFLATL